MKFKKAFLNSLALHGTFYLDNDINPKTLEKFSKVAIYARLNGLPLTAYIKSSGGDVPSCLKMYSIIRSHPFPTKGILMGEANSAAGMVLQAFDERLMHRYNTIYLHALESRRSVYENVSDEARRSQMIIETIFVKRTKLSEKEVKTIMESLNGKRFFDQEALDAGLVDGFINEPVVPH